VYHYRELLSSEELLTERQLVDLTIDVATTLLKIAAPFVRFIKPCPDDGDIVWEAPIYGLAERRKIWLVRSGSGENVRQFGSGRIQRVRGRGYYRFAYDRKRDIQFWRGCRDNQRSTRLQSGYWVFILMRRAL
jgi:hypothetical protein